MALRCGIVGLPNVGKSTLFNALTSQQSALAANYPFATIEPNVGIVAVPDVRLQALERLVKAQKVVPATIEFVDIAGLVEGASKGEGLGNQFLSHIREVDAVIQVVRCFDDPNIVHVNGSVNPTRDMGVVSLELILKDLDSVERRIDRVQRAVKAGDKKAAQELDLLKRVQTHLLDEKSVRTMSLMGDHEKELLDSFFLLSAKPILYAANVAESEILTGNVYVEEVQAWAKEEGSEVVVVSAEIESQLAQLAPDEKNMFLEDMGLENSGLERLIKAAYHLLGLITYITAGVKEVRAWTITRGTKAPGAAGVIHSDFERGFIRAETIKYEDYVRLGSESAARQAGLLRAEGKEYVVQDGDVIHFLFNV
ncbi:MAG TPA: redox-regulated ATPase YchF [Rhodothermales bacterium]|nr:redox-regulated ATPase YchF [Rhodothermales bacterium]